MSQRHQYLSIQNISAGMVLADDLLDKLGHVLLPAGVCLTEAMLKSLHQHHVQQLSVLVDDAPGHEQDQALALQKKRDRLEKLFRHAPCDGPTATLLSYLQKYRSDKGP